MRQFSITLGLSAAAVMAIASESATVLGVPAPDQLLVEWRGIPVVLPLAYLAEAGDACRDRLQKLAQGKVVELQWLPAFGTTAAGAGKLLISLAGVPLNRSVVEAGLAKYQPGEKADSAADKIIAMAQDKARKGKLGLWAETVVAAAAKPAAKGTSQETAKAAPPTGKYCAELSSRYYYPIGHKALANVDSQRLIHYADEAAAKRAGKRVAPAETETVAAPTMANADRLFQEGKSLCSQAMAKGNSPERDKLYGDAFPKLNQATQIYASLAEKDQSDDMQEKLRQCMQMRYSSMKYRRFE
jgi:hypothetical protein